MTKMNLVLQGPDATAAQLDPIAALAAPARVVRLSERAVRCEEVEFSAALKESVEAAAYAARVDATFIAPGRKLSDFKLLAMDMDSTLITIECIDEIADMQGLKPQVAEITEAAMRGELDFSASLTKRVALLKGLDAAALQRVYDERLRISLGGEALIDAVKEAGLKTLLVSGGFTFFTERLQARLGLSFTRANVLEVEHGRLTGRVAGTIVDAEEKMRTVQHACTQLGIEPKQAIVMGDGANDLKMMAIAGLSVAFRAKPVVRAQADIALNFCGLDAVATVLS